MAESNVVRISAEAFLAAQAESAAKDIPLTEYVTQLILEAAAKDKAARESKAPWSTILGNLARWLNALGSLTRGARNRKSLRAG